MAAELFCLIKKIKSRASRQAQNQIQSEGLNLWVKTRPLFLNRLLLPGPRIK